MGSRRLLVINAGSSSLKLALFALHGPAAPQPLVQAEARALNGAAPACHWRFADGRDLRERLAADADHAAALHALLAPLEAAGLHPQAIAHRIVHGGSRRGPEHLDTAALAALQALVPLAPLHQPAGLALVGLCAGVFAGLPQYACYDTDFHHSLPELAWRVPLPQALTAAHGIRHYGFHGLSYQYVWQQLALREPALAQQRLVIAHLGAGASLCALHQGESRATTMGFSALEGLPMASRCGRLDPGIPVYLQQQGMRADELERLLYQDSGLKALSGHSGDMRALLAADDEASRFAVAYFCERTAREIAAMASAIGGLDALVFTAGIGENAPAVRAGIAERCAWLGLALDAGRNAAGAERLSADGSRVAAFCLPTDEAAGMAAAVAAVLAA